MKKIAISILLNLLMTITSAQQTQKLTLQESISLAIDSSLQSFRAENMYMAGFWEFKAYKAARLPSLNLNMTPLRYNREFIQRYDPENNIDVYRSQQSLYSSANFSLNQNLDLTGGTFFIDSELGFLRNIGQHTFSQFNSIPIRIGYMQSLVGFNKFRWEKRLEPLKYEKAKKQFIYAREEVAETVIEYFFNLAMAQAEYEMALDNIQSADTLFRIGEERFKIASISQADMYTLKLDAINAKNSLKNSEIDLKKTTNNLRSFLNINEQQQLDIILPERPTGLHISEQEALAYSINNNPNYLNNQQEIMEAEMELERISKNAAFQANLQLSAGFNQVASSFAGAYKNPLQQNIVTVGLSIPLIDWGVKKGKINMAKNNLKVAQISIQQKEISLQQDIILTVNDFNIQQDMINSAEEALNLSISAYNATKQRFIIGKSDINSLTLSLNRQKDAQKNYISALRNYWISYYKIRKLTLYDFEKNEQLSYQFDRLNGI
ncbi:TolC family protein [Sphingobacterium sp. UT-1RO-CII-1]|uniref:TolC family protein n=1 Tax=Sphingobacterium sp. UT-1RO-CII-1 TaxID=2995225 RepID=UPI00227AE11D|nr:TolC family protein [Sphingobacterium sp. UT-1RO-CII-1]MCY4778312.1 TolC family protein [Sphingobacterium sp. UT-1RO-CII-1]